MAVLAKNGVQLVAFLTEVDFREINLLAYLEYLYHFMDSLVNSVTKFNLNC